MGLNFRRSMKIMPGVRLNFSKNGIGASFGTRGARYSISPTGRRTISTGIPGTGISYREQVNSTAKKSRRRSARYLTPYATREEFSQTKPHRILAFILIMVALASFGNAGPSWNTDKRIFALQVLFGLGFVALAFFVAFPRKYPEPPNQPSELDTLQNSRFLRDPLDLAEWELTNKEYQRLVELLNKAGEGVSDNSEAPTFPVQKGEVVLAKFTGAVTDYDGLERSETGTIYITDKRVSFISAVETEEWKFENMAAPIGQGLKRVMTFPLTTRKKVSGVVVNDNDWERFIFAVEMGIGLERYGEKAIAFWNQELGNYQNKKPKP